MKYYLIAFFQVRLILSMFVGLLITGNALGKAVDNAISYQGRLDISGMPANGFFDFGAVVYDSLTEGDQIGSILTIENVEVVEGLVNLDLDFGEGVFIGEPRFLELRVRDLSGGGGLVILEPRQRVQPAPDAINTRKVDGDIIQKGIIGSCESDGSSGISGTVVFLRPFSETPFIFLTPDESFNNSGCIAVRVTGKNEVEFSWRSTGASTILPCDCIHWLAIGPP
ncbi:MAG: hypothetical protein Tsb002_35990 [Wenzhouxiangellaceae bacterium]